METAVQPIVRFGDFGVDTRSGELRKSGRKIRLPDQSFQILTLLLDRAGEVVTREELHQRLWPAGTFVDFDAGLNNAVRKLRDALGDSAEIPRYIETLPRRGYRFIAAVEAQPLPAPDEAEASGLVRPVAGLRSRGVAAPVTAVLALAAGVTLSARGDGWRGRQGPVQIRSVAVLPFENLTGDPEQEYFVDGMTEALTTDLAHFRALRVISRTSAMQYKRSKKSLPRIADELNVDAVVEGAVARSGDRVRVTAQLIFAPTDHHLWARTYERELRDVLALQAEVAGAIAQAIQVELQPEERSRIARAVDPDAYDAYLKGRFYWSKRSPQGMAKAIDYFQRAIEKDPTYAPAYSGLSDAYRHFGILGLPPRECMPKAEAAARKALALDDTLAEAHTSLAAVLYRHNWDWAGAEREFQLSLEMDPSYAEGHRAYAIYLLLVRRAEEAVTELQRARELSPLSIQINVELASTLVRAGQYDEAIEQLQKTLEIHPKLGSAYVQMAEAYEGKGDRVRVAAMLDKAVALSGNTGRPGVGYTGQPWVGYAYALTGRRREALEILAQLEKRSQQRYVSPQHFALIHLGLGDKDQAFVWLEKAYEERSFELLGFSGQPFDGLHDDPRFRDLLRRMRLPVPTGGPRIAAGSPHPG
jgi:TolB-like protein/DNA-binding winged helix-turn-helix (wHTH) protein/Flp pilus assembly protein TadD